MNNSKLYDMVFSVLQHFPETRDDDFLLYGYVCHNMMKGTKFPNVWNMTFGYICTNHLQLELPSYESVTRLRRKVQENEVELQGEYYHRRKEKAEEYREEYRR